MKLKSVLVVLLILINLIFAQPSWASKAKLTQTPEYTEVTESLNQLLQAKTAPQENSEYTPTEIEQKIGQLQLQKYILETASHPAQCRNETGNTLAIYAHKGKKAPTLFYLGNGKYTDDDWSCDGVYLPSGAKLANATSLGIEKLTEAQALKITPGTQLVISTNPQTGAYELNVSPAKVFKAGDQAVENSWSIPNLSVSDISTQVPNAPIDD
ncbi:hypothetical protein MicvaDRAFT_4328 [Rivularia sp. IAM M-261]|nr:hypothetical protein MicvaDRAFT_4328 [Calothrix sp. PCC 7716]GJD18405.1 hypothetical protein MicvaDRAFT_4328 [Rivularia sp. IAM M-261]